MLVISSESISISHALVSGATLFLGTFSAYTRVLVRVHSPRPLGSP